MKRSTMARLLSRTGTVRACAVRAGFGLALLFCVSSSLSADPLQTKLLRLSEILGAVHHLREVCGANEGPLWRNKMIGLLEITRVSGRQREALVSRFNAGFYKAGRNFPVCTGKAIRESNALLKEGQQVSGALAADTAPFSGGP